MILIMYILCGFRENVIYKKKMDKFNYEVKYSI